MNVAQALAVGGARSRDTIDVNADLCGAALLCAAT